MDIPIFIYVPTTDYGNDSSYTSLDSQSNSDRAGRWESCCDCCRLPSCPGRRSSAGSENEASKKPYSARTRKKTISCESKLGKKTCKDADEEEECSSTHQVTWSEPHHHCCSHTKTRRSQRKTIRKISSTINNDCLPILPRRKHSSRGALMCASPAAREP